MSSIQLWDCREEYQFLDFTVIILGVATVIVIAAVLIGGLVGGLKYRDTAVLIGGLVGGLKHRDTSGCGLTSAWTFDADGHYNATMGNRSFLVHVPPSYTSNTPYPVVLSFHGYGDDDTWQEHITGFSEPGIQINNQVSFMTGSVPGILYRLLL